ncbi:predicted protein [Uncinocarpus reesii 1704]|uniref:NADH dehydrogenase [ubiquinone] 1 alpha subcomplex subunit 1 n=1 Tax=Uncinocarpus reesii (strain UAMH 1704) TaxID=336963 RepID=C4JS20_UNCRE|nr:uncharacterized protein UREG_05259 [Uncinocarpus reesii 1704]EEP80417.1 predicted protein [Uncinocarpus reesii 1704]
MPLPFEALLPYGIIIGFFGVTGIGLSFSKRFANDGKRPRRGIDAWDRQSIPPISCVYTEPRISPMRVMLTIGSDGTGFTAYGILTRPDRFARSAAGFLVE